MTYTISCPDQECKTVFSLEEEDFDEIYEAEDPIECPGCETEYEWTFDPAATPEIVLTEKVVYTDEPEAGDEPDDFEEEDEE